MITAIVWTACYNKYSNRSGFAVSFNVSAVIDFIRTTNNERGVIERIDQRITVFKRIMSTKPHVWQTHKVCSYKPTLRIQTRYTYGGLEVLTDKKTRYLRRPITIGTPYNIVPLKIKSFISNEQNIRCLLANFCCVRGRMSSFYRPVYYFILSEI